MQAYLIQLQPLAPFYFGSERNFGTGEDSNYFATSRQTPQQTTLLGVLRYKLLEAHNGLSKGQHGGKVEALASDLIGKQSFMGNAKFDKDAFGKIFLLKGQHIYLPANVDDGFSLVKKGGKSACVKLTPEGGNPFLEAKNHTVDLDGYNPKKPPDVHWTNDLGERVKAEKLFQKAEQVGVFKLHGRDKSHRSQHLNPDEEDGQKGFFKKIAWKFLSEDFRFAFVAYLEKKVGDKLVSHLAAHANAVTPIGGERSPFRITAADAGSDFISRWENGKYYSAAGATGQSKIILISDAFADLSIYNYADFSLAAPLEFRNLQTTIAQTSNTMASIGTETIKQHLAKVSSIICSQPVRYSSSTTGLNSENASWTMHLPGGKSVTTISLW